MARKKQERSKSQRPPSAFLEWTKRRRVDEGSSTCRSRLSDHMSTYSRKRPKNSFPPFATAELNTSGKENAFQVDQKPSALQFMSSSAKLPEAQLSTESFSRKFEKPQKVPLCPAEKQRVRQLAHGGLKAARIENVKLTKEQAYVVGLILSGYNVFFTGPAGTGKSLILKVVAQIFRHQDRMDEIFFTAPTGIAACNIGGTTLHSYAGIGLGTGSVNDLFRKMSKFAKKRWQHTQCLIVDEVSMLGAELFDKVAILGSRCRRDSGPFGGLQVVLCGDFFQLPPVGLERGDKFAFESQYWDDVVDHSIILKKVFRQKDTEFRGLLRELRLGIVSEKTERILKRKVRLTYAEKRRRQFQKENAALKKAQGEEVDEKNDIVPTKLFPKNRWAGGCTLLMLTVRNVDHTAVFFLRDVDLINLAELGKLDGIGYTYQARDIGNGPFLRQLQENCRAPINLTLKVGAQVMLLKNLDPSLGLVNGTRGVVIDIQAPQPPTVTWEESRDGLDFLSGKPRPVVRFKCLVNGAEDERVIVMQEEKWEIQLGDEVMAVRTQIPLRLAWALSMHKSQGMSISDLEVTLDGTFACGQAYVALSRATTLEGLRLNDFSRQHIMSEPKVAAFYRKLEALLGDDESESSPEDDGEGGDIAEHTSAEVYLQVGDSEKPSRSDSSPSLDQVRTFPSEKSDEDCRDPISEETREVEIIDME